MKRFMLVLMGILVMSCLAFGQVDTMRLAEVGSVVAPGNITNWYFQDLNGDSIKEIILTTANSVNIYNGQTFSPIWSQDGFTNPTDLNFADINNDGLIDFSVKDTSHIYLIDPHHSTTIWTSPMLDSLYQCYTIGNRNGDSFVDVVIVTKEIFARTENPNNQDTVWIKSYDGPLYNQSLDTFMLCTNCAYYSDLIHISKSEYPKSISLQSITVDNRVTQAIIIINNNGYSVNGHVTVRSNGGTTYICNSENFQLLYSYAGPSTIGLYQFAYIDSLFLGMFQYYSQFSNGGGFVNTRKNYYFSGFGSDTCNITNVWSCDLAGDPGLSCPNWNYSISEKSIDTMQIGYSINDSIYLKTFPYNQLIWCTSIEGDFLNVLYFISIGQLNNYLICSMNNSSIIYKFLRCSNSTVCFVLPTNNIRLSGAVDLQNTHTDYLYSVNGNLLNFYALAPRTGIDNDETIPTAFFLSPNYPNPFNSSTLIEYGLPLAGLVKVDIFDILGRKIQTLVDETQAAGYHQVTWKADNVPSGMYFYRIQAGDNTQTRKCLLIK